MSVKMFLIAVVLAFVAQGAIFASALRDRQIGTEARTENAEYRTSSGNEKIQTDWLFIYYMPYDNNLSIYGQYIVKFIGENILSENVIAVIQAEYANSNGMKRYLISNSGITVTSIDNDRSASIQTYREYLEWVKDNVEYNKLAVIFLDHGGKLDEICLDERPIYQFLKIDDVASVLIDVLGENSIELLFLQVCTKGVIEALYEFRNTAKYTLSSQIILGAPNYYYPGLFSAFSNHTISTGYEAAELIVNNETTDMYSSYTLIDNSKMENLHSLFSEYINQIRNRNIVLSGIPITNYYADEIYWDTISFLQNMPESEYRTRLTEYIKNELIVIYKVNPLHIRAMDAYSGLSMSGVTDNKYDRLVFYKLLEPIRELLIQ